jgi:hypothetical protein
MAKPSLNRSLLAPSKINGDIQPVEAKMDRKKEPGSTPEGLSEADFFTLHPLQASLNSRMKEGYVAVHGFRDHETFLELLPRIEAPEIIGSIRQDPHFLRFARRPGYKFIPILSTTVLPASERKVAQEIFTGDLQTAKTQILFWDLGRGEVGKDGVKFICKQDCFSVYKKNPRTGRHSYRQGEYEGLPNVKALKDAKYWCNKSFRSVPKKPVNETLLKIDDKKLLGIGMIASQLAGAPSLGILQLIENQYLLREYTGVDVPIAIYNNSEGPIRIPEFGITISVNQLWYPPVKNKKWIRERLADVRKAKPKVDAHLAPMSQQSTQVSALCGLKKRAENRALFENFEQRHGLDKKIEVVSSNILEIAKVFDLALRLSALPKLPEDIITPHKAGKLPDEKNVHYPELNEEALKLYIQELDLTPSLQKLYIDAYKIQFRLQNHLRRAEEGQGFNQLNLLEDLIRLLNLLAVLETPQGQLVNLANSLKNWIVARSWNGNAYLVRLLDKFINVYNACERQRDSKHDVLDTKQPPSRNLVHFSNLLPGSKLSNLHVDGYLTENWTYQGADHQGIYHITDDKGEPIATLRQNFSLGLYEISIRGGRWKKAEVWATQIPSVIPGLSSQSVVLEPSPFAEKTRTIILSAEIQPKGLPQYLEEFTTYLQRLGHSTFAVGGCVRDAWLLARDNPAIGLGTLAKGIQDIDLVTTAPPGLLERAATSATGRAVSIWAPHLGLIRFGRRSYGVDVVPMRVAEGSDESSQRARFAQDITRDAKLRDFTINALYLDVSDGKIIDPTGHGIRDLNSKTLRLLNANNPYHIARYFKFRQAGYLPERLDPGAKSPTVAKMELLILNSPVSKIRDAFKHQLKKIDIEKGDYKNLVLRIMSEDGFSQEAIARVKRIL